MNTRIPSTGKPRFIMVGVDRPDGSVRLYASRELPTDLGWGQREVRNHIIAWHIDADLTNVLIIDKPTWGEAFARAFEIWGNWDSDRALRYAERKAAHGMRSHRVLDGPANLAGNRDREAASERDHDDRPGAAERR